MTVTNNYLSKQELVSQKVQGSISTGFSGFDSNMNPVFAARIATSAITSSSDYVKNTFGDIFVAKELDGNSTTIRYSTDKTKGYLVDKQGDAAASWKWDSLNIEIPDTIRPALDIVKSLLDPIKQLVSIIKEAMQIAASLVIGLSEALRILVEEVINVLISALEWFNVEVSMHVLFVPPIVPTPVRDVMATNKQVSDVVVKGASEAVYAISSKLADKFKVAVSDSSVAGNVGFYNQVIKKINDTSDTNRPQFKDSNYIAGCSLVAGYPVEAIYNIYARIQALFKSAPRPKNYGLPKNYSIKSVHYIKSLDLISFELNSYNLNRICLFEKPTIVTTRAITYLAIYNKNIDKVSKSTIRKLTSELDKASVYQDITWDEVVASDMLYTLTVTDNDQVSVLSSDIVTDSSINILNFSTTAGFSNLKLLSGEAYAYKMYTFQEYVETYQGKSTTKIICLCNNLGQINVPVYGKFNISTGSGKSPTWIQVSSMFDLFEFLGEVRDVLGLIRKYVNSLFSKYNQIFKNIIESLDKYLNFILTILAKIDTLIDFLKDLAGLGVGASMLFFQGEGGNTSLKKILKDAFIDMPNKLYSSSADVSTRPDLEDMSLAHTNWNKAKVQTAKYYSRLGSQLTNILANTTQDMAGSFPPNFNKDESVTGLVLVGGGDSIDNVLKLYNLLLGLFSSSQVFSNSDDEFKADVSSGVGPNIQTESTTNALNSVFGVSNTAYSENIPGAYSSDLTAVSDPVLMLEDYCK